VQVLLTDDPAAADAAVARAIDDLRLPVHGCDPEGVFATVHEDASGRARVLFVVNSGDGDVVARVTAAGDAARAVDLIDDAVFDARRGVLEVRMPARTVRMLALE